MNLNNHVATRQGAPKALKRPFYIVDTKGTRWSGACDEKALVLVKAKLRLNRYDGEGRENIVDWVEADPVDPQTMGVTTVLDWTGAADDKERVGVILEGVQIDKSRLAKLLVGTGDVVLWDASKLVNIPCLGLTATTGVWKAFLAGYDGTDDSAPVFGAHSGSELFDLAMDL